MAGELTIEGYASLFWARDLNDDLAQPGCFAASLAKTGAGGVRMLYQHEAKTPIGVWDEIKEDSSGLFVRGRIVEVSPQARLAAALVRAGALDGLSIGFRTEKARPDESGRLRVLAQVALWEVSLVTFPMLPGARITTYSQAAATA